MEGSGRNCLWGTEGEGVNFAMHVGEREGGGGEGRGARGALRGGLLAAEADG